MFLELEFPAIQHLNVARHKHSYLIPTGSGIAVDRSVPY